MKSKLSLFILCIFAYGSSVSQNRLSITQVNATAPVVVNSPLIVDSVNLKKEKFETKQLLETMFLAKKTDFKEKLVADTSGVIFFPKAKNGSELRFFSFNVNVNKHAKLKVRVTAPGMLELYVGNKKESSKTTAEDSLKHAKDTEKEITVNPGTVEFAVKYLSQAQSKIPQESVKITVESSDSTVNLAEYGNKRLIRINDIIEGTRVRAGNISPNGRYAILSYSNVIDGGASNDYRELLNTQTGKTVSLDRYMSWMPVSNKLYYVAQRGENNSLISVDPETLAETVVANNIPKDNFRFMHDEKRLIYTEKESYDDRKGDLMILESPADRQDGYFDRYFIYIYDIATGVKQRLTYGKHTTSVSDVSRDSRYLLFTTGDENITERPFRKSSLFLMDLQSLKIIDTLWKDEKYAGSASFSPNGQKLLVHGAPDAFGGIGLDVPQGETANSYDDQIFIMDIATKKVEPVSKKFDPSVNRAFWHSDNEIYLLVTEADYENVYRYDLAKKSFTRLSLAEDVIRSFNPARDGTTAIYAGLSSSNTTRAYTYDLKTAKSVLVSDPSKERFENITLGKVRDWDFISSDGTVIKGRYYLPPVFDSSAKYPVIVYYYGGTTPTARVLDHPYPMHVYASMGYVVYVIQPSGTIGFGQEFSARHVNAWGKRTADDIIEGVKKFAAEHSFVNEKKIGCIGASYGGFMTMYLQTVTDIFAAAISHAGISALSSYWGEGYWGYAYSAAASADSYPWNNRELYVEQSPLFNADKIKTPLLLLHGLEDTNVPVGESFQMYTALKILGRPVEFIRVKGENHGIATYNRRLEWNYSIYAWFAKWLQDDSSWWDGMYPKKEL
ncbi:MAG: prolyl oligopeptidase family serine peptidase [Prevotellaceae bacterium]|jgi:dipeptidyl aminopeptidase/acylaminoacyl peptidase|nr:prolyl oligopeptidase family serine peptidase [Prevotellaceae bacterium]